MDDYVSVIGGSHVTVGANSFGKLSKEGNYGVVSLKLGGEARNISERLALLDVNVKLITALGRDVFSESIKGVFDRLNVDYSQSLFLDASTSAVVEIANESGDEAYRIFDYRVLRNMDRSFLESRLDVLSKAKVCFLDAEFDFEKLEFLCKNITCPIFIDPVSIKDSGKLRNLLRYVHTIKPNKNELENLVGFSLETENNFLAATELVLQAGAKNVFVTCGKQGVWYNDGKNFGHIDADSAIIVNKAGAGCAFDAALIKGFLMGKDAKTQAKDGVKAAAEFISCDNISYL